MAHYTGQLIYTCSDAEGVIEVVDEPTARSLHFGTRARQTTMFLRDPHALALNYTQCLMSALLFFPSPGSALILGLGGGALARFLLHAFPQCQVAAVERRALVIDVARAFFHLPEDPRLRLYLADAADFLRGSAGAHDLVLVDLHDPEGMAPLVSRPDFFPQCQRQLAPGGVLAINLWAGSREDALKRIMRELRLCFDHQVLYLPVAGKRNCVALGLSQPPPPLPLLQERARGLQTALGIDFPRLLAELLRLSPHLLLGEPPA
jgi:spermidine synthase